MIKESKKFPGFYHIPNYRDFIVNKDGVVMRESRGRVIKNRRNTSGYYVYSLIRSDGERRQISRARIMCTTFKPTENAAYLQVDHVNCNKGDDRLENLEWVTGKENCQRASKHGLYKGARPVMVRDIDTKEVTYYESIAAAGRALGMNKDAMLYRLERNDGRIYPERKQYSFVDSFKNWADIENAAYEIETFGHSKRAMLLDLQYGGVREFDRLTDVAKFVGMSLPGLSTAIGRCYQPVLPGLYLFKFKSDQRPWRHIDDPFLEQAKCSGKMPIVAVHAATGHKEIYSSQIECAEAHRLLPTTLNARLHKSLGKEIVFSNGYTYRYYSTELDGSTTIPQGSRV